MLYETEGIFATELHFGERSRPARNPRRRGSSRRGWGVRRLVRHAWEMTPRVILRVPPLRTPARVGQRRPWWRTHARPRLGVEEHELDGA
jgi:hypothetical protein